MSTRACSLAFLAALIALPAVAKDKKKSTLPEYVLHARTVLVVVDPDAGEPLEQPTSNATARDNVEKALSEWGRFELLPDGARDADLVITVRTGSGRAVQPTIKGGPVDQRPGTAQGTDSTIRIGAQQGQSPPLNDPSLSQSNRGPQMSNEIGPSDDTFAVYRGGVQYPLEAAPVWRYIAKDSRLFT